jgi:hypothetical protein
MCDGAVLKGNWKDVGIVEPLYVSQGPREGVGFEVVSHQLNEMVPWLTFALSFPFPGQIIFVCESQEVVHRDFDGHDPSFEPDGTAGGGV